ncbi:MAG: 50S ribosomal protein L24 [Candidatus Taylorbacteria bacterium]|nr:50S ribosomal protein L24 [Candidatus Taylorbacteria bacterium]
MNIKKGDNVIVIAGKEKGKTAKVVKAIPSLNKVVLEGLNMVKKHKRASGNQKGQLVEFAAPIHVSNVSLADKVKKGRATKKATK